MYVKFHCECNFIEEYWGDVKRVGRERCDYSFAGLKESLPSLLDSVSLAAICKYDGKSWRYIDAYHKGLAGMEAERVVKKYRSHRRIYNDE